MAYEDLKEYGTEAQVKAVGKLRQQGKTCKSISRDLPNETALDVILTDQTRYKMEISVTGSVVNSREDAVCISGISTSAYHHALDVLSLAAGSGRYMAKVASSTAHTISFTAILLHLIHFPHSP